MNKASLLLMLLLMHAAMLHLACHVSIQTARNSLQLCFVRLAMPQQHICCLHLTLRPF